MAVDKGRYLRPAVFSLLPLQLHGQVGKPISHKATWYAIRGPNGDLTWRVQSPAEAVGAKICMIPADKGFAHLYWPNTSPDFPWHFDLTFEDGSQERVKSKKRWNQMCEQRARVTDRKVHYPKHEGISAVWTRPLAWQAAHMMELRSQGVRVLAEVDDNYLSSAKLNVFMRKAGWGENDRDHHARSICNSDGLIVSTDYLRNVYHRGLKEMFGSELVPDIFVCRNHIDESYVIDPIPPRADGRLRIGYMGSDSHIWDVDLAYDALFEAFQMGHEIVFVGISPAFVNKRMGVRKSRRDWSKIPYTHIPWQNEGYRGTALPLDIGLAPLLVDEHTNGKSDIKVLEYTLSGAASVAHNSIVYNRTLRHGEHCLLAGSPAEYTKAVRRLIFDDTLRARLVEDCRQYIQEERLLSRNTAEWEQAVYG